MVRRPEEHCGVVAIASARPVAERVYYALRALQHRGQESAGIATFDGGIRYVRGMGLVHEVFDAAKLAGLPGTSGIGHTRYSTAGASVIENAQPIVVSATGGDIALAHNGDIVNVAAIKEILHDKGWAFITSSDTEVIIRMLANEIALQGEVFRAARSVVRSLVGSYSLVFLQSGRVFGLRDPWGIKPLCIGRLPADEGGGHAISSESCALDNIGAEFVREVKPGELVEISPTGVEGRIVARGRNPAHCMFEWVYFTRPDSMMNGRYVYDVRYSIGRILAGEKPVPADIVVPVPDSGRAQALGFSVASGIPFGEGLMKNKYVGRTFIMPTNGERDSTVRLKLNAIKSVVAGKRVVLVDDSIVRGTTMRRIVQHVRSSGATQVHVRIGCPPIVAPCYLGIDMKTREQLVASTRDEAGVARAITADSVGYLSIQGLIEAIGLPRSSLCMGCLTGEYPVEVPGEKVRQQARIDQFLEEE